MAVDGHYMAERVRFSAVPYVRAYGECILRDIMPAFSNLEKRADEVADAAFERFGSEPAGEDFDGDMSVFAERAEDKGHAFYETMTALRQMTLNLFAAGLFHLIEQQLADLCYDGAFTVPPPTDTKLSVVACWHRQHFHLELRDLPSWPSINELRLVANAVKHAEGGSAEELRSIRPELFENPLTRELWTGEAPPAFPIRRPLAGEDLYVTEELFREYSRAANEFMAGIAAFFDSHGNEWYPR